MINVTKTYLPDKKKFQQYVDEVFNSGWITNEGPLVKKLEKRLANYLGVKNIILVSSGTSALEIAYRTLGIKGSVITTPFSFVATTSSLVTNGLRPIFADIDPKTLNINHKDIESLIEKDTQAIVPVHIFGNSCEVDEIDKIAKKNNLKVIYDAAHAFGVKCKGQSILNYGDISTLSFHATKLFHTIEGGALVINDDSLVQKARYLINFGIENSESIPELGTNAKMNELEAAMGLCVLDDIEKILDKRKTIYEKYFDVLGKMFTFPENSLRSTHNYSYFPIIFSSEILLYKVLSNLNKEDIYPRRYFYTSLDSLEYIQTNQYCEYSRDFSKRVLCLPIYPDLKFDEQEKVINTIYATIKVFEK